jgi:phosphatidylinositol-3,4,5-trisphosphate 3-phosphatase/dual-specificity protein phosphatase PTEN
MFDWLRRIVAGAKNRTVEGDYDLDLTYITDRIVAMAFPASGLEQTVRNCIGDVSSFLTEKH